MADNDNLPEGFNWRAITPDDSPKTPMDIMSDPIHKGLATTTLAQGDLAYDFESRIYDYSDGTEKVTPELFRLAQVAKEKPVALIFGSYT